MFLYAALICCILAITLTKEIIVENQGYNLIWIASRSNTPQPPLINVTDYFYLDPNTQMVLHPPDDWSGRIWARTECRWNGKACETGDCGRILQCDEYPPTPPASFAEFHFNLWEGQDYYDISIINGTNVPLSIIPTNPVTDPNDSTRCAISSCKYDFNADCPEELKLINIYGLTVGCNSACVIYNTDEYCCRGNYTDCNSSKWPVDYINFFKSRCPNVITSSADIYKKIFTCDDTDYRIVFF